MPEGERQGDLESSLLLFSAVKQGNQAVVAHALPSAAPEFYFEDEPPEVRTALRLACSVGKAVSVRLLLQAKAEVSSYFERDRWTALHTAAAKGHDKILRQLLLESPDLHETKVCDGFSFLHHACEVLNPALIDGGADFMQFVLQYMRPDVNVRSTRLAFEDWTPLHIACYRGKIKSALKLIRAGADIKGRTGSIHLQSPNFMNYADGTRVKSAKAFATFTQVPESELDSGLLPVHLACLGGHVKTVHCLLRNSDDLFAKTGNHEWMPLHCAVWSGSCTLVQELLRMGARKVVNRADRRTDARWTPLALAVAKSDVPMAQLLLQYKADPLQRIAVRDFPGTKFLAHVDESLHVTARCPDCKWSGPDDRVSLLHLAVVKGDLEMLRLVTTACRTAHFNPLADITQSTLEHKHSPERFDRSNVPRSAKALGARVPRVAKRLQNAPLTEHQGCDPLSFTTVQGWSPAVLAMLLAVVDHDRVVKLPLVEHLPHDLRNSRRDLFKELLLCGRAFGEDQGQPPVIPQRFGDVCEPLVMKTCFAFAAECRAEQANEVLLRCTHMTLSAAARTNRLATARYLLEEELAIAPCPFILPVASRPLHAAASLGFGAMVQLLVDHGASASEPDEQGVKPIEKLAMALEKRG